MGEVKGVDSRAGSVGGRTIATGIEFCLCAKFVTETVGGPGDQFSS